MSKNHVGVKVEKNAFVDEGDGVIRFPNKLVLTDDSEQRNGTRYDIQSMDLGEYDNQITADHSMSIGSIIGKVGGLAKIGNRVVIDAIQYAVKENPLARLAYDLTKGGYAKNFSIETYGEPIDEDGIYKNSRLVGLSQVVVGNNRSATINEAILNSITRSKQDGLDVDELEKQFLSDIYIDQNHKEEDMSDKDKSDDKATDKTAPVTDKDTDKGQPDILEAVKEMFDERLKPLQDQITKVEKNVHDKDVSEPEFQDDPKATNGIKKASDKFKSMGWEERAVNQIESFRRLEKQADYEAGKTLREINEFNLGELKGEGLVKNDITIGDLGNYVISPEQLSEIVGFRSNYGDFVNAFTFRETLSTVTQWLKRSGDIDMTAVDFDPAAITDSGYLKPVSDYSATLETLELEELAAVTPVANAATRFLAADILSDVNQGYRTDYQRKLAELIVVRLEQAVDSNGNSEVYNTSSDVNSIKDYSNVIGAVAESTPNGVLVMNYKSYWQFVSRATGAGISGPLANLVNTGSQPNIFGIRVVIVPNDLLPTLNTAETVQHTVGGSAVTIDHSVFYVDPSNFVGRVSGGLQYDLSTDAAYEISGTVRSAFQRNQIVLRGSFFRGGAVSDETQVSGLLSEGVS